MRFLLTFLLLVCIQSFVVCTQKDGSITFVQKSIDESVNNKARAEIFSTNTALKFTKIHFHPAFKRVHQLVSKQQLSFVKDILATKITAIVFSVTSIKFIEHQIDFSYRYMLNCLYPKHSFW